MRARRGSPVQADNAVPGQPTFLFENITSKRASMLAQK